MKLYKVSLIFVLMSLIAVQVCQATITGKQLRYIRDGAISGDLQCCLDLGNCYFYGNGVPKDYYSAFDWYYKAANSGSPAGQFNVALCYDRGIGVRENKLEALAWYRKAAKNGVAQAKFNLALLNKTGAEYSTGDGIVTLDKNLYKAEVLFRESANQGFPPAIRELAKLYLDGDGVEKNQGKALELITMASEKKDPEAMYLLAEYHLSQNSQGSETVVSLLQESAKNGHPEAVERLGELYETGNGVEKNLALAFDCYKKAAEAGLDNSEVRLADYYYYGIGIDQDLWNAKYWFREASDKGHPYALFMTGIFADQGIGEPVNKRKAASYFMKSARKGFSKAQYNLAIYYQNGTGIEKSIPLSLYWFRKAALQNDKGAQRELGIYYMDELSDNKSYSTGLNWLNLSRKNGDSVASSYLKNMQLN